MDQIFCHSEIINLPLLAGRPELLQFPPYNKDQIIEILNERLKDVRNALFLNHF